MIGAVLGVAEGLLPVKPFSMLRQAFSSQGNGSNGVSRRDEARFSEMAQALRGQSAGNQITGADNENIARMRAALEEMIAAFEEQVGNIFAAQGIDTSQPINLTLDSHNRFNAHGHPDAEAITAALRDHPELVREFREIAGRSKALESVSFAHALRERIAAGDITSARQYRQAAAYQPQPTAFELNLFND